MKFSHYVRKETLANHRYAMIGRAIPFIAGALVLIAIFAKK